ncbi:MAG: hypothetical protein AW07_03552 [Candidatus Accumulibacter sp. SK-11]|nr:MAG: hypothetical protein AW07_03552 [Candidatus Accumulibacter sp. SK-11]
MLVKRHLLGGQVDRQGQCPIGNDGPPKAQARTDQRNVAGDAVECLTPLLDEYSQAALQSRRATLLVLRLVDDRAMGEREPRHDGVEAGGDRTQVVADRGRDLDLVARFAQCLKQRVERLLQQPRLIELPGTGRRNALVRSHGLRDVARYALDGLRHAARFLARLADRRDQGAHGRDDPCHLPGEMPDDRPDPLGRLAAALGELAHLVRHDRETPSLLAGAGRLDGRVQCQQVGLSGDFLDRAGDFVDLPRRLLQVANFTRYLLNPG